jgi:hypothetical protein
MFSFVAEEEEDVKVQSKGCVLVFADTKLQKSRRDCQRAERNQFSSIFPLQLVRVFPQCVHGAKEFIEKRLSPSIRFFRLSPRRNENFQRFNANICRQVDRFSLAQERKSSRFARRPLSEPVIKTSGNLDDFSL